MYVSTHRTFRANERKLRGNQDCPKIKYGDHKWIKCTDFKLVNFLLGQQSGYLKCSCLWCLWKSRARDQHWVKEEWLARENWKLGNRILSIHH